MKKLMLLVMCAFVAGMAFADEPPLYKTLETDGRGYILTDYQPKTGRSRIEYDLRFLYLGLPFGLGIANGTSSAGATNDKEWGGYFNAETRTFTYYTEPGDACANFGEGFCDTSVRHTVSMGQGWVALDSQTNVIATAADDYTTGGKFALFAANFGGTTFSAKAVVRVAGIRIFEDDTLVRDWVPAKDANGTATLYDLVNGKFETVKAGVFSVDDTVDPTWEVQAANGWTVQPTVPASIAAGTLPTISLGTAEFGDGTQTATYTAKDIQNLPVGTYTQVVEVASTAGYRGLRKERTFTVTGTVPTAASVAPTAVAPLGGASVATHTAKQKEFIGLPAAMRKRVLSVLYERERAEYAANDGHPQPVRLRWDGGDGACTIHVYRGNETTPVQTHTVVTRWTDGNFFDLDNLEIGQAYRWTVTNAKGEAEGSFVTEDETPRLLNAGVVGNTRDLGGYVGLDGRRVRQGMFLRSRCFDTNERTTYGSVLTATEEAFFRDFIGLKTEIDLRGDTWITQSFVPGVTTRVNTAWPLDYTGSYLTDATKKSAMKAALAPIFDEAKYPIDVHCHSGQDRTGMYCFILEALLGVSEADCIRDWECSALGNSGFNTGDTYQLDSFLAKFRSLGGATTQAKAETFMKWLGYSSAQIDAFREIMLEPIGGDEPDDLVMVTFGDHPHLAAAWTSGDGSVTNAVDGADFRVEEGTTNVRVIFTADPGWEIVGDAVVDLGTVASDIVFGNGNTYKVPEVGFLVTYLDYDADAGTFTNAVRACTPVTSAMRTLAKGWYAVTNDVDFPKAGRLQVSSDARLILCDGASLTITNVSARFSAVTVAQSKRFTIYGQTEGTGRLTVCGGELNAGIGGYSGNGDSPEEFDSPDNCGMVTINGGTVVAQGGQCAAGIGGSMNAEGGTVTINGGTVVAQGGRGAAGIGNARQGHRCVVRITGGKVTARKGREISGRAADDIGYGECTGARQSGVTVEISGGVFANPLQNEWCRIHYAPVPNTDSETCADYPYTVRRQCVVTVGGHPLRVNVAWTGDDGSATNEVVGESFDVTPGTMNLRVIFTPTVDLPLDGDAVVNLGTVTGDITFGDGNDYRIPRPYSPFGDIEYLDWNGSVMTNAELSKYDYLPVTEATRELETGWYAVTNDVVFPQAANLRVKGNARLVLCDGASLAITNGPVGFAAVEVNDGKSLAVYGQSGNTGALTARGSGGGAGIGGASESTLGKVTVFGGTVTAQGGDTNGDCGGAGIGGGYSRSGAVEIRGGRVAAHGGGRADDIGRGENSQNAAAVTISGGIFRREPENGWLAPDSITVENPDEVTKAAYPWTVVPQSCTVTVGNTPYMTVAWTSGDGTVTNVVENKTFSVPGGTGKVCVIFTAKPGWEIVGENVVDLGAVLSDIAFGSGSGYKLPSVRMLPVEYVDADGVVRVKAVGEFTRVTASTKKLADGKWYAVIDDVTLTNSLPVEGSAHLILCDWATLAITNRTADAAISVGVGASLTIYGQTEGTGRLEAKNGNSAAGIGGDKSGTCGTIAIHGGTVKAEGGTFSAGIGGGMLGNGGTVTITGGRIAATGRNNAADIGNAYGARTSCEVSISGGVFARELQDAWLAPGFAAVANTDVATKDEYPWAIEDRRDMVSPNNPRGPYATAVEATNEMAMAVFAPDVEVADVLTTQAARARYAGWFGLDVAERCEAEWYVEAVLTDAAKSNLAEIAAAATRQIPVAAIAAMDENSMTNVTLVGCEPGFYYTLYGGPELADLSTTGTKYWSEVCDAEGKFSIPVVSKPSEAAGFFTIGVDAERPDNAGVAIVGTSVKSGKTVPGVRKVDFGGADGSSVSVWLENVKPKLAYGLGRSDVPQGPFVVEDGSWVMADEDGVLHKALTAPKVGPRNFYMIIVR